MAVTVAQPTCVYVLNYWGTGTLYFNSLGVIFQLRRNHRIDRTLLFQPSVDACLHYLFITKQTLITLFCVRGELQLSTEREREIELDIISVPDYNDH